VSTVIAPVACEVPAASDAEVDCVVVEMAGASVRVCMDVCAVVAGLAKLARPVPLSTGCSETPASELLAVGDSLVLLCSGTLIGSAVDAPVGPPVDMSVVVARRGSAVAWTVLASPVSVVKRAAVCFMSVNEPLSVGQ
jgi:hypothetical protein